MNEEVLELLITAIVSLSYWFAMLIPIIIYVVIFVMIFIIIFAISMVMVVGITALTGIPYYNMAKRAGISKAWLAFLPIGQQYIMTVLSKREFNLFNKIVFKDRRKSFKIYAWSVPIATVVAVVMILLFFIPVLGIIMIPLFYMIFMAYAVFQSFFVWRWVYDLLITYGMKENAMLYSILSCFVPYMLIVLSIIIMNKEPDYNA